MSDDAPLKSAYELAMERLQAEDREAGVERRALSDEQKERVAELRRAAQAKLAELEIRHRDKLGRLAAEPEKLAELEEEYRIDRDRIERGLESDVEAVKRGD